MNSKFYLSALSIILVLSGCSSYMGDTLLYDEAYQTSAEIDKKLLASQRTQARDYNSSSPNEITNELDDYYNEEVAMSMNRIPGPGYNLSPFNDPFMNRQPGLNFGIGASMNSLGAYGLGYSVCYNCYDPFMNPYGWMPMSAYYTGMSPFYDPFMFGNMYNPWNQANFYNPYLFMPPVVVLPSLPQNGIIRSGSNQGRGGYYNNSRNTQTEQIQRNSDQSNRPAVIGTNRSSSTNYSPNRSYSSPNIQQSPSPSNSSGGGSRSYSSPNSGSSPRTIPGRR